MQILIKYACPLYFKDKFPTYLRIRIRIVLKTENARFQNNTRPHVEHSNRFCASTRKL